MGFFDKLKKINIFASFGSELTDDFYDELEESLILADTGMDVTLELVEALRRAGATFEGAESSGGEAEELSAADMYTLGLSGRPGSAALRAALLAELGLPGKLQGASLRGVLSALYTREELERALSALPAPQ